jgi:pimeloyl-ACP methyl ester carboxylesterase
MSCARRFVLAAVIALIAAVCLVPAAGAQVPHLSWQACDDGFQCATATVPLDYAKPDDATYRVALIRKPATGPPGTRIGTLFTDPGGPGASGVDFVRATAGSLYPTLNQRYDIVGFDPRGTGGSDAALSCQANQETEGIYAIPYARPETDPKALLAKDQAYVDKCTRLNQALLPYVTTGNVARDLDQLRQAVGDSKLNYLGFSYGTFIGATYGALFPGKLGHVVLDGPVDANGYINDPAGDLQAQTSAFERALGRFFTACAGNQITCLGFGGADPETAFDQLVEQADANPIPAAGDAADPRPVTGDDILNATISNLYAKQSWPEIAKGLAAAAAGDGSLVRQDSDDSLARNPDGSYDPGNDRYFLISAIDQQYPHDTDRYLRLGKRAYDSFDHFWFNSGYVELNYGLFDVTPNGRYAGPFTLPDSASTPLVVATTYDPATPYRGAKALVADLGNARLLTMRGDGHTAYGRNSPCIDAAVNTYMFDGALPAAGTVCQQQVPFVQPQEIPGHAESLITQPAGALHAGRR